MSMYNVHVLVSSGMLQHGFQHFLLLYAMHIIELISFNKSLTCIVILGANETVG
jgi:hypothetical protein